MSKWKCEICGTEFKNFHAQGFEGKIYCPLCYFKKENLELRQENQKYKEVIDKAKELINKCVELQLENDYLMDRINLANYNMKLLDILKEVE